VAKAAQIVWGLLVVALGLSAEPAHGQRVQFPSMVTVSQPGVDASAAPPATGAAAPYGVPPPTPSPAYSAPATQSPTMSSPTFGPAPVYGAPPAGPAAPYAGGVLPPPTWDPNASVGPPQPKPLFPGNPTCPPPGVPYGPDMTFESVRRFLQQVGADYTWMAGGGATGLGENVIELTSTFALPIFDNPRTPLLVTPGFAMNFFNTATTTVDVPTHAFDAYLDTAWHPQATPWLGADLGFRIGVYSDFTQVVLSSIRLTGNGLAVVTINPTLQAKLGVIYLDRVRVTLLPAGGLVWTPNADVRFELLFPNPRVAQRLTTIGTAEWWLYARGEYGGDSWTVKRTTFPGEPVERMDYNDLRVAAGLEFDQRRGVKGLVEVGVAFDREILYDDGDTFRPDTTVFLRAALAF